MVFRKCLAESGRLRLDLLERFENDCPISKSYVSMLAYKDLLDALAAADFEVAVALAHKMGGRPDIERNGS